MIPRLNNGNYLPGPVPMSTPWREETKGRGETQTHDLTVHLSFMTITARPFSDSFFEERLLIWVCGQIHGSSNNFLQP